MKDRTKEIIRDGFGSFVNNASAMRGAKAGPLWLTLVMFFLGVFLPVIPLFVSEAKTNGSSFVNTYSYGLEKYVTNVAIDLKDNRNAEFIIDNDHLLSITENGNPVNFDDYDVYTPYATYVNEATHQYDFMLYISNITDRKEKAVFETTISQYQYFLGTTDYAGVGNSQVYTPTFMVLFKDGADILVFGSNTTKNVAVSFSGDYGDYQSIAPNNNCLETLLKVEAKDQNKFDDEYVNGVYANFKKFLDLSYKKVKAKRMWGTSGIYLGVFFGVNIFMGLLMWLLTRGKNNPNSYFSPWLCLKIQGRMCLCPGLLTMVIGFFLTSQAMLIYIMTIGLRVMWISMKELRPIQQ